VLEFLKRREPKHVELPAILQPENPVNYDSVLDWLLGLSPADYQKMIKVVENYREAKKNEARILKVKDEATTQLITTKQTDEEIETDLDGLLETDPADLKAAILAETPPPAAPSNKKIVVKD
jgi:hypothetical protein